MPLLTDRTWQSKYDSDGESLVTAFYQPALARAIRYDRTTGYFSAPVLTLAARGIEELVRRNGHMRLIVGCTLDQAEVEAIEKGSALRDSVEARLLHDPLTAANETQASALELLAWMVATGHLEIKVAVPCGPDRRPVAGTAIFHEKAGILEDEAGNRLAFSGGVNETPAGWLHNWDSFHVFCSWEGGARHIQAEEESFGRLWADRAQRAIVIDVPAAARQDLLRLLPSEGTLPRRVAESRAPYQVGPEAGAHGEPSPAHPGGVETGGQVQAVSEELRRLAWGIIRHAPALPGGGAYVGEATANVQLWPHQVRTFQRLYDAWPPRLLIADEVGLGKTIEVGLVLRQAWLAGKAKRILIMAPKAILRQWQTELREKFNLNWPIYDGQELSWYPSPALREANARKVSRDEWHREPCVLTSSQLMRRGDRAQELLGQAEPWDLVVLDEAHHARRRGAGGVGDKGPNQLLKLMRGLKDKTPGLILMTATPMQVAPIEVWDLLDLLGLPADWTPGAFTGFFDRAATPNPSHEDFEYLASLFRSTETVYGEVTVEQAQGVTPAASRLAAKKLLDALRDRAVTERRSLAPEKRRAAVRLMQSSTPAAHLISRNTRELLRAYYKAGKISTPIAERDVKDCFVQMTPEERAVYDSVEDYISTTFNQAAQKDRNAIGFVMTVYRKRMASSFAALGETLRRRREKLTSGQEDDDDSGDENPLADEALDAAEAAQLKREALQLEERGEIERLRAMVQALPADTKVSVLLDQVHRLRREGYAQAMVFTQYADSLDFLRERLVGAGVGRVLCFSGRGGEQRSSDGSWTLIGRDDVKRVFRERGAEILLCTDAAAEGLNFQFCGAVINYDMPWNPMRVEQRIGRIDRLGQEHAVIRIVNLHYQDSVETDVYMVLRERINLFGRYVGKLQPILSRLPQAIASATLAGPGERRSQHDSLVQRIAQDVSETEASGFDIDAIAPSDLEVAPRPAPLYDLEDLDQLLHSPDLLPPSMDVQPLAGNNSEYRFRAPGQRESIRITTSAAYFDEHPESTELWSPGNPTFQEPDAVASPEEVAAAGGRLVAILVPSSDSDLAPRSHEIGLM